MPPGLLRRQSQNERHFATGENRRWISAPGLHTCGDDFDGGYERTCHPFGSSRARKPLLEPRTRLVANSNFHFPPRGGSRAAGVGLHVVFRNRTTLRL
jgi:hypothetical protein